jgi:hypothetical protein
MMSFYKLFTISMLGLVIHFVDFGNQDSLSMALASRSEPEASESSTTETKVEVATTVPSKPKSTLLKAGGKELLFTLEEENETNPFTGTKLTTKYGTIRQQGGLAIEGCDECQRIALDKSISELADFTEDIQKQVMKVAEIGAGHLKKKDEEVEAEKKKVEECESGDATRDANCLVTEISKKGIDKERKEELEEKLETTLSEMMKDPKTFDKAITLFKKAKSHLSTDTKRQLAAVAAPIIANKKIFKFSKEYEKRIESSFQAAMMASLNGDPNTIYFVNQARADLFGMQNDYRDMLSSFPNSFGRTFGDSKVLSVAELDYHFANNSRFLKHNDDILSEISVAFAQPQQLRRFAFEKYSSINWKRDETDRVIVGNSVMTRAIGATVDSLSDTPGVTNCESGALYYTRCLQYRNGNRYDGGYSKLMPEINSQFSFQQRVAEILGDNGISRESGLLSDNRSSSLFSSQRTTSRGRLPPSPGTSNFL